MALLNAFNTSLNLTEFKHFVYPVSHANAFQRRSDPGVASITSKIVNLNHKMRELADNWQLIIPFYEGDYPECFTQTCRGHTPLTEPFVITVGKSESQRRRPIRKGCKVQTMVDSFVDPKGYSPDAIAHSLTCLCGKFFSAEFENMVSKCLNISTCEENDKQHVKLMSEGFRDDGKSWCPKLLDHTEMVSPSPP